MFKILTAIKTLSVKTFYIIKLNGITNGASILIKKILNKLNYKLVKYFRGNRYKAFLIKEKYYIDETNKIALEEISNFKFLPTFSIIMPVYNVDEIWLRKAIESVKKQTYSKWELCIADDASPSSHIRTVLTEYSNADPRIKVVFRKENGGISAASNTALALATGEYIALVDNDDEISPNALFENARLINLHPEADLIYSDEDKIDESSNRFDPFFKPDWSPEYLYGCMYVCHLSVYRRNLVLEVGAFRSEYDGSQDYDLVLRVSEKTKNIFHISKILYHWRTILGSAAADPFSKLYTVEASKKALEDTLRRREREGIVEIIPDVIGCYRVHFSILENPLVSIIIPSGGKCINTMNGKKCLLENCISSLINLTTYKNFEIIIVDGFDIPSYYLDKLLIHPNVNLIRSKEKFNFSQRTNLGAAGANGDFFLLLNDDVEVINSDWLVSLLEICQIEGIGAVGAKLFYPNYKLQHVGVVFPDKLPCHTFYGFKQKYSGYFHSTVLNRNYLAVTGACLMVSKSNFYTVHGFEEALPLNFNDVDFCLKLHKAGLRNVFTPYAQLFHFESATRQKTVDLYEIEYLQNNWFQYLESIGNDPYYNPNFSKSSFNFELP